MLWWLFHVAYVGLTKATHSPERGWFNKGLMTIDSDHCHIRRGLGSGINFLLPKGRHRKRRPPFFVLLNVIIYGVCLLFLPLSCHKPEGRDNAEEGSAKRSRVPLTWSHPMLEPLDMWDNLFPYGISQRESGFSVTCAWNHPNANNMGNFKIYGFGAESLGFESPSNTSN